MGAIASLLGLIFSRVLSVWLARATAGSALLLSFLTVAVASWIALIAVFYSLLTWAPVPAALANGLAIVFGPSIGSAAAAYVSIRGAYVAYVMWLSGAHAAVDAWTPNGSGKGGFSA